MAGFSREDVSPPPEAFNFARYVMALNGERGKALAYIDDAGATSYAELDASVRRFASALRALGIQGQQRVLILLHDSIPWPIAFLGSLFAGIVPIPVNTLWTSDDLAYLLEHSGASAAILSAPLVKTFNDALIKASGHECSIVICDGAAALAPAAGKVIDFHSALAAGDPLYDGETTHRNDIAFWLYSSGSTGRPKGIVHTHANLFWTSELYGKSILGVSATDRVFSAAKLFFAYGLGNALTFPLAAGACTVLMAERPTPEAVFKRLLEHRPTVFCGAPTLYAGILASPSIPARSSLALRVCTSAGEPLPRELGERFAAHFGAEILDGLGSTEMLHIFVSNRPGDIRYGTSGMPVDGYEIEIRDEHGNPTARGELGDLWVKGPSVALRYWNDEKRTREAFVGPWLRTGDKYVVREDGYHVYAGRNDDMMKISGQYVSPFEVESTLSQHTSVLESAVIGVTDKDGICKCKAYVVLKHSSTPDDALATELKLFVKDRLAPFKRPHYVVFVPALPRTATGKLQRFKLHEMAGL